MTAWRAQDIAHAVGGRLEGDQNCQVDGAAGLEDASEREISFFHNFKYVDVLGRTRAGIVLIPEKTNGTPLPKGKTWIRVSNPQWAFAQVLGLIDRQRQRHPKGLHPQSVVHPSA